MLAPWGMPLGHTGGSTGMNWSVAPGVPLPARNSRNSAVGTGGVGVTGTGSITAAGKVPHSRCHAGPERAARRQQGLGLPVPGVLGGLGGIRWCAPGSVRGGSGGLLVVQHRVRGGPAGPGAAGAGGGAVPPTPAGSGSDAAPSPPPSPRDPRQRSGRRRYRHWGQRTGWGGRRACPAALRAGMGGDGGLIPPETPGTRAGGSGRGLWVRDSRWDLPWRGCGADAEGARAGGGEG